MPLTQDHNIVGTLEFLAPELLDGEPAGPGTDLWALGVTLYYALCGQLPFSAESTWAVFAAIKSRNLPQPREGGPLASLVLQMLRKRPQDRPDAATVAAILRGVADQPDQPPELAYQAGPRQSTAEWPSPAEWPSAGEWQSPAGSSGAVRPPPDRPAPHPARRTGRRSALSGVPVLTQAQLVAAMPTDQAVEELLALPPRDAASIIMRCAEALGGNLLSAIAVPRPWSAEKAAAPDAAARERAATARKILRTIPPGRHGVLVDHLSSIALAALLVDPPLEEAVRIADRADVTTVVGAIAEMAPVSAVALAFAMGPERAREVLGRVAIARIADMLTSAPVARRQELLARMPDRTRTAVRRYLGG